jgi:hypothetical protein
VKATTCFPTTSQNKIAKIFSITSGTSCSTAASSVYYEAKVGWDP